MAASLDRDLISICIPTYQRATFLLEALASCVAQTWPELELVIGDDSPDDETERAVATFVAAHGSRFRGRVRYAHHRPSLRQNGNVQDLFARATGGRLVLLHDDDMLLPQAVEQLARLWEQHPQIDGAFGKQLLVDNDGSPLELSRSDALNRGYFRTAENAGLQPMPVVAGLRRMFPNDGFLVDTQLARQIGYRPESEVGHACDTDFGIRFCAAARGLCFLDEFMMQYRISEVSISSTSIVEPYTYEMLTKLEVPAAAESMLQEARRQVAPGAVSGFVYLGRPERAWQVYRSADYPWSKRLHPRGLVHLARILGSLPGRRS